MNLDEIRTALRASPLLRSLGEDSLRELATRVRIARWDRNQVVLRKGDPGNAMMIVISGRVKITSVADSGRERILNIIEPGESFGEMALLDGEPRCADCVASEPTTAIVLGKKPFTDLLASDPSLSQHVIADLCRRLRKTTNLVEDTMFVEPPVRLARRLRALAHETGGSADGGGACVLEGLSQQDLADAVGLTRESVNKLLRGWLAEGVVSLARRTVVVKDLVALDRIAHAGV